MLSYNILYCQYNILIIFNNIICRSKKYISEIIYKYSLTKDNFKKLKKELETNSLTLEIIDEILIESD